ncbi:phage tail spike protein [Bacillus alveayuensis]|uniref:phage tail spike protein n=1 Tax=Aeribacillus alveayuensis TaxID=279215 RepID=UPI0006985D1E|nr:phage tail spike protein [Bacillus alveayuensis]
MLFIFDKYDNLLTILDSSSKGACPYYEPFHEEELNGPQKLEFVVPATHPDAQYVVEENQVAFKDEDGYFRLFVIREIEETDGAETAEKHVYCEPAMSELENEPIEDIRPQNTTAQYALTRALEKTRWRVGEVAELGTNSTNFYYESVLSAIQKIIGTWGGELRDRIEVQGNRIAGRYIDLLARRGQDTGKRFEIGKDLESIRRKVVAYPVTALYGRGNGQETDEGGYTRKLTFADVEWKKSDGKPVDKPKGQEWVGDPDALQKYGIPNGDGTLRHRFNFVDFDEDDPEKLLERTWEELQKRKEPLMEYQLDVIVLEHFTGYEHEKVRLGDSIVAIDKNFANPIVIEARATKIRRNLLNKAEKTITFGNFIDKFSTQKRLDQLETKINDRSGIWDQVEQPVDDTDFPDIVPPTPSYLNASGGFKTVMLEWNYDPSSYIAAYEVYGSQVQGFTPDSSNLLFRGKTSTWVHQVDTNQTWYYRVRAINTHGTAGGFSQEASAQTARIISDDILFGAVNAQHIADLAVTAQKLAEGAVTDTKIANRAVNNAKLADLSISAEKLRDGIIDEKKLADLAVTASKLANGAVTSSKIDSGAKQEIVDTANQYTNTYAEKKIAKGSTAPLNPAVGDLWIDTSVTPNLLKRWTGSTWQKLAPTTAAEIGAVDVNTYNTKVQQLSNDIAAKADATWVNGQLQLKENVITKSNTAPANPTTGQLWLDTSTTPNVLKRWTGSAWVKATPTSAGEVGAYTKTEVDNALNSKVSVTQYNTDMNGVVTRLNSAESRITQNEQEIATKVSNTTYQQDKTDLQNDISALETRMANAETSITQNANQIALKANKTDVYTKTEVNNQLANKADNTTVNALETRISEAEAQLTIQANEIATKVSQTTFTQELSKKENAVTKSNSAPSNPSTNQLWLDTSVTPNVLKRWNGSAWVKATPTTAGEVGAYTKSETDTKLGTKANQSDLNTLTTRVSTAETNITQLSNQITLKANASDVYTKQQIDTSLAGKADVSTVSAIEQRVTQAEAQLTVQAGEIASKVSRTEFESLQIGGRNLLREFSHWSLNDKMVIENRYRVVMSATAIYQDIKAYELEVFPNTSYTLKIKSNGWVSIREVDVNGNELLRKDSFKETGIFNNGHTFITKNETVKLRIWIGNNNLGAGEYYFEFPKLEIGNKPTDWTPAPEDVDGQISGLDARLSTAESSITQLSNQITLKVNQSQYDIDVNNLKSRMSSAESQLTIQAGQIATKVEKDGVISAINQTSESIKIQAKKIELIGTTNIQDGAINSAKIADASIISAKIANLAVGTAAIADGAIINAKIANLAVGNAAIQDGAITNAKIANAAIDSAKIANAAITSAHIASAAVGNAAIQNGAITNAKIGTAAVGTAQIADAAITNAKIANLAVDDAKIANLHGSKITASSITADKLNVTSLSAISADLGTVTAGTLSGVTIQTTGSAGTITMSNDYLKSEHNGWKSELKGGEFVASLSDSYVKMNNNGIFGVRNGRSNFSLMPRFVNSVYETWLWAEENNLHIDVGTSGGNPMATYYFKNNGDFQTKGIELAAGSGNRIDAGSGDGIYLKAGSGNTYAKMKNDGAFFIVVNGVTKHSFYASGTKSGGSIVIDGKNLGMSPVDSPQILIEYIEFDVPLISTGTKVYLEDRFRKAVENFAVFSSNGQIIEKGYDYFVIAGEGTADVRIVGERIGYANTFFDDLDAYEVT